MPIPVKLDIFLLKIASRNKEKHRTTDANTNRMPALSPSVAEAASAASSKHTNSVRVVPVTDDIKKPVYSVLQPVGQRVFPGCISTDTLPRDWHSAHMRNGVQLDDYNLH